MADPDLAHANISLADVSRRLGVAGFGAWWIGELASLAPQNLRSAIERRRLRPVIAQDGDRLTFWQPSRAGESIGMRETASVALTADTASVAAQGAAAIDAIFAANPGSRDVTLALDARQVLRRSLTMPSAIEDNLRATIGYDLDRLTPFKPDDVYFDAAVASRDPVKREITVDVVAARRRVVDQALALARAMGANVVAVVADPPERAAMSRINLLSPEDRVDGGRFRRWQFMVPMVALLAVALAAVAVPLWQKRDYAIAMMNTADEAASRAQQSDRLRSELERMVGQYNFALERKYTTPGVAQVLDEVTRLLPDDTWLTQFEVKSSIRGKLAQRELFMRGESANAGKLISLLENATLVGEAAPRSPTTKLQPGPGESFDIGAHLKTTPVPATIALTEAMKQPLRARAAAESAVAQPAATKAPQETADVDVAPDKPAPAQPAPAGPAPTIIPATPGHPAVVRMQRDSPFIPRGGGARRAARDAQAAQSAQGGASAAQAAPQAAPAAPPAATMQPSPAASQPAAGDDNEPEESQ